MREKFSNSDFFDIGVLLVFATVTAIFIYSFLRVML